MSEAFQLVRAKYSEVNVVVAGATPEEDPRELPVPEQFITSFDRNGRMLTTAAAHSGA